MTKSELKEFLDEKVEFYNNPNFIESDPIQIPHFYSLKEDIEIAGFLAATIAWGNRKMIINNAKKMMDLMGNSPYDFVMSHSESHLESLENFVHRTFNGEDCVYIFKAIKNIYNEYGSLGNCFSTFVNNNPIPVAMSLFRQKLFSQSCQLQFLLMT